MRYLPRNGEVVDRDDHASTASDLLGSTTRAAALRGDEIAMVYQEPARR